MVPKFTLAAPRPSAVRVPTPSRPSLPPTLPVGEYFNGRILKKKKKKDKEKETEETPRVAAWCWWKLRSLLLVASAHKRRSRVRVKEKELVHFKNADVTLSQD